MYNLIEGAIVNSQLPSKYKMNLVPKHVMKIAAKENSWAEYSTFRNK